MNKLESSGQEFINFTKLQDSIQSAVEELDSVIEELDPKIVDLATLSKLAMDSKFSEEADSTSKTRSFAIVITAIGAFLSIFLVSLTLRGVSKSLKIITSRVANSRNGLSEASIEITNQSEMLTDLVNRQLSGFQETVSSVAEITSMIRKNAESSEAGKSLSEMCEKSTMVGQKEVEKMFAALQEIEKNNNNIMAHMSKNSRETLEIASLIEDIDQKTKVINDIVFQTKLLSFNASVEAARAGEHGKGFAVVAEEIGGLAAMSGAAAKEIGDMLALSKSRVENVVSENEEKVERLSQDAQSTIETGNASANSCLTAFSEVMTSVRQVNQSVTDIATASREQASGMEEISRVVVDFQTVAQDNADLALKTATAGKQIQEQVSNLGSVVVELIKMVDSSDSYNSTDVDDSFDEWEEDSEDDSENDFNEPSDRVEYSSSDFAGLKGHEKTSEEYEDEEGDDEDQTGDFESDYSTAS